MHTSLCCLPHHPAKRVFQHCVPHMQFLLVLSAYKTSHQWLQHPSNTVNTLCGSDLGAAQAEGYLWWPDAGNTAASYCVQACPQAQGDWPATIRMLQHPMHLRLHADEYNTCVYGSIHTRNHNAKCIAHHSSLLYSTYIIIGHESQISITGVCVCMLASMSPVSIHNCNRGASTIIIASSAAHIAGELILRRHCCVIANVLSMQVQYV